MARPKKQPAKPAELTIAEKEYIRLRLKTANNINYDQLFKEMAVILSLDEQQIRDFADKLTPPIVDEQLPPEPKRKNLSPVQENIRTLLTPNRKTEPNKARHITVMSEMASEQIEQLPASVIRGSSKLKDAIFRQ